MRALCILRGYLRSVPEKCITSKSFTTLGSRTSSANEMPISKTKMGAWYIEQYGGIESLSYDFNAPLPVLRSADDVLVEVRAASVNPLDVEMTSGYGRAVIGTMRSVANLRGSNLTEFPLILGRDFSGVVTNKGPEVKDFHIGDEVMGVVLAPRQGSHAHFAVTPSSLLVKKPQNLTSEEAASLCYAGLTAWSALTCFGGLSPGKSKGKRAIIFGGSGGVGTIAIQLLKSWGATVCCVSSSDAVDLVSSLGADIVFDYTKPHWQYQLKELEAFDFVLNCVSHSASEIQTDSMKKWRNARFVTVTTPLLRNVDSLGWPLGVLTSSAEFAFDSVKRLLDGQQYRWAYVLPSADGLKEIARLSAAGKLIPVVERVYPMEDIKSAYEKVKGGHARGKTVINIKSSFSG